MQKEITNQVNIYGRLSEKTRTAFPEGKNVLQNKDMHLQAAALVAAWGRQFGSQNANFANFGHGKPPNYFGAFAAFLTHKMDICDLPNM